MKRDPISRATRRRPPSSSVMVAVLILTTCSLQHVVASHMGVYYSTDFSSLGVWRGGAAAAAMPNSGDADGSTTSNTPEVKQTKADDNPKRRQRTFWKIGSLFELNAEAQEEALEEGEEMEPLPPGNGRGGALAIVKPKPPKRRFLQIRPASASQQPSVTFVATETVENAADAAAGSKSPMRQFLHLKEDPKPQTKPVDIKEEKKQTSAAKLTIPPVEEDKETIVAESEVSHEESTDESSDKSTDSNAVGDDKVLDESIEQLQLMLPEEEEESQVTISSSIDNDDEGVMGLWWNNAWTTAMPDVSENQEQDDDDDDDDDEALIVEDSDPSVAAMEEEEEEQLSKEKSTSEEKSGLSAEVEKEKEQPEETILTQEESPSWKNEQEVVTATVERKKKKKKSGDVKKSEEVQLEQGAATEDPIIVAPKKKRKKKKTKVVVVEEPVVVEVKEEPEVIELEEDDEDESLEDLDLGPAIVIGESPYISSGAWEAIDNIVSLGLAVNNPSLRFSRHMRSVRKATAKLTGMHGFLSGKQHNLLELKQEEEPEMTLDDEDLGQIRRRIAAIDRARKSVELKEENAATREKAGLFRPRRRRRKEIEALKNEEVKAASVTPEITVEIIKQDEIDQDEEGVAAQRQKDRVKEIDRLMSQGTARLAELACEKDALQQRPNPLYNYTTTPVRDGELYKFTREFNFPSDSLVEDYLDDLFANGRLITMNHTQLWQSGFGFDEDEDESIGDDLLTPSADASRLYEEGKRKSYPSSEKRTGHGNGNGYGNGGNGNGGGGSWLLRQSIGKGGSLGEKIGEAAECSGYRAVCAAVMSSLARAISGIHGTNIMTHSDIRLFVEQGPDLPPIARNALPPSHYAQDAINGAMMKGRSKRKKKVKLSEEAFIQRDAVVETLLSHCQISAPLLKLFPLAWQRALLANMITLITHVVSDFCDGIELQILGHSLTFSFKPITESDMIRHIGLAGKGLNHRRARPEEFEAAVRATAEDISHDLKFLDRWHERALGSGMLRAQIANLIARIVLTLADEVLSGARMDLWAAQAGGPRVVAGLEYRTTPQPTVEDEEYK